MFEIAKWICRIDQNGIQHESDIIKTANLRKATISDLPEMKQLFIQTIQSVCKKDYNSDQIKVWVSGAENTQRWIDVIEKQFVLLAILENKIVGYGTLKEGNYIDFFFIHKDFQRQGIANKIFTKLELEAKNDLSKTITSDVSITAKPFFEKKGFIVKAEQKNLIKGVEIINYKMEKEL
ncbi:GNAT family N-acetyltransferase [Flavobacterium zhairuonense]|nr:GNAT family N-acetyltransferase [Flavobacterium zhairuonense]